MHPPVRNPWQDHPNELSQPRDAVPVRLGIVEDDEASSMLLAELARKFGFQPEVMGNGRELRQRISQTRGTFPWDLVVLDLGLPDCDGLSLLQEIKQRYPDVPCMVLTVRDKARDAVMALRSGAAEYAVKPIEPTAFFTAAKMIVAKARQDGALPRNGALNGRHAMAHVLGFPWKSKTMAGVNEMIRHALSTTVPVLIEGEPGTGKQTLAHGIHRRIHGGEGELVEINAGQVEEKAFNLAIYGGDVITLGLQEIKAETRGLFRQTRPSTLLLREVERLPLSCQERLCRALEEGTGRCRVLAIANQSLDESVLLEGAFVNLFYQLATLRITLPPLRVRMEDLIPFAEQLITEICVRQGWRRPGLDRAACRWLRDHDWPGNIPELRAVIQEALERTTREGNIGEAALAMGLEKWRADFRAEKIQRAPRKLDDLERAALVEALKASGGNRRSVAAKLGVSLRTVYNLLDRHGLKGKL